MKGASMLILVIQVGSAVRKDMDNGSKDQFYLYKRSNMSNLNMNNNTTAERYEKVKLSVRGKF